MPTLPGWLTDFDPKQSPFVDTKLPLPYRALNLASRDSLPPVLYHYTSRAGYLQILQSKSLWASDLRFANDSAELAHGIGFIRQAIIGRRDAAEQSTAKFLSGLLAIVDALDLPAVYAVSFCAEGDQLSQWRGYGSGGGFAVGFPTASTQTLQFLANTNGFVWVEVAYDDRDKIVASEALIDELLERRERLRSGQSGPDAGEAESLAVINAMVLLAGMMKDSSFREEKEWRLCTLPRGDSTPKYRSARSLIVPYLEVKFTEATQKEIHVVVGPCPHANLAKRGAGLALEGDERSPRVQMSHVPFRDW